MKRILVLLLILTACNRRISTTEIYHLRPDCWKTNIYVASDNHIDTVRYRIDCPQLRSAGYNTKASEPKWNTIYVD
jgi:hypothetical protein